MENNNATLKSTRLWLLVTLILLLSACATNQHIASTERGTRDAVQLIKIKNLESQIKKLKAQISALESAQRALLAQLEQAQSVEREQTAQIKALELSLAETRAQLAAVDAGASESETQAALLAQLASANQDLRLSRAETATVQSQLSRLQSSSDARISTLEHNLVEIQNELQKIESISASQMPSDSGSLSGTQAEDSYFFDESAKAANAPTIVKVFYGTNRATLSVSFWRYLSPFTTPLVLLLILLATPVAVRAVIRTYLHQVTINLFRVSLLLALIYFSFSATHQVSQRWQAAHDLALQYGPDRLVPGRENLPYKLGIVNVSIPPVHAKGAIEQENFIYFEFRSDPAKHFVLNTIDEMSGSEFFNKMQARVNLSPDKDLFVFVHGFHNTFKDAAFRTAQIAHDSGFKGAPVFYSWPSQGTLAGYTTDENNVNDAKQHLTRFLEHLRAESGAQRIHLIAHSMGSRALTSAVQNIVLKNNERVFDEMILAAPDLDAGVFKGLAHDLTRATSRLTLYASSKDEALKASRKVHGGKYKRAGESYPFPVIITPVETIDVSNITSGHSYISDNGRILDDLNDVLTNSRELSLKIARRVCSADTIEQCQDAGNIYWQLRTTD